MNEPNIEQRATELYRTVRVTARDATCPDCGELLDAWGCCPNVSPAQASMGIKTCGKQENTSWQ